MALAVHARGWALTRDGNDWRAIHVRIRDACHKVGSAWSKCRCANASFPRQTAINIGHKGSTLFVTGCDELNRAVQKGIHNAKIFFAWNSENILDAFILETFHQELCGGYGFRHISSFFLYSASARTWVQTALAAISGMLLLKPAFLYLSNCTSL